MKFILMADQAEPGGASLLRTLLQIVSPEEVELVSSVDELELAIRRPRVGNVAAVLLAGSREVLEKLFPLAELLYRFKLILLLPDREQQTLARAHLLRPRFLGYADDLMAGVGQVLARLAKGGRQNRVEMS